MIYRTVIWLAAVIVAGSSACAEPTGAVLYKYCRDPHSFTDGNWNMGFCSGYIDGIVNALQLTGTICVVAGTRWGTADNVVVEYLSQHPEIRDQPGAPLALAALAEAFPCQKPKPKSN